jgi:3-isopropylmalate/(R)-2-methylmalate dehydratase small subunit
MEKFGTLTSLAAPLPVDDIDTDIIFPARFLLITDRDGLGRFAFYDWRFEADGSAKPFVMAERSEARILIAGANFGCGSSREHAVWALHGLGIRCVIAPSFGEIFHANCVKNGVLPVTLDGEPHARLLAEAEAGREVTIDLPAGIIRLSDGSTISFDLPARQREALINGWDEIDLIRARHAADIRAFETEQRSAQPWLWAGEPQEH